MRTGRDKNEGEIGDRQITLKEKGRDDDERE
jgi:hypothetical protein